MSNDDDEDLAREKRRRKHLERLGFLSPRCFFCGEDDVCCLQLDHIAGREFSDDVIVICANCHAARTDRQKDHPPKAAEPSDQLEVIGRFMCGVADFLLMLAPLFKKYGVMLCAEAAGRSPRSKA